MALVSTCKMTTFVMLFVQERVKTRQAQKSQMNYQGNKAPNVLLYGFVR